MPRSVLHVMNREGLPDMPYAIPRETGTFVSIEDPVLIPLRCGRKSRVKIIADTFRRPDRDIRRQQTIQRVPPITMRAGGIDAEARDLSHCVHARIRAACRRYPRGLLSDVSQNIFNDPLNGGNTRLCLPAMIPGAIVLDDKPDLQLIGVC